MFLGTSLIKDGSPIKIAPSIRSSARLVLKKVQNTRMDLCKTWLRGSQLNFVPPLQVTIRSDFWHDAHAFCPNFDLKVIITGWICHDEEMFKTNLLGSIEHVYVIPTSFCLEVSLSATQLERRRQESYTTSTFSTSFLHHFSKTDIFCDQVFKNCTS